jgi:hypothetical protein
MFWKEMSYNKFKNRNNDMVIDEPFSMSDYFLYVEMDNDKDCIDVDINEMLDKMLSK